MKQAFNPDKTGLFCKGKLTLPYAMKVYGRVSPLILNLETGWVEAAIFMPWLLYPYGKSPPVPNEEEAFWDLELVWTLWKREKSLDSKLKHNLSVIQSVV